MCILSGSGIFWNTDIHMFLNDLEVSFLLPYIGVIFISLLLFLILKKLVLIFESLQRW